MATHTLLFYVFSAVLLISAFRVITARSMVHAALFLVLAFFSAACIWMLLHAEFLSIALVLVYIGAVMVLFLFVVMMLDINIDAYRTGFWRHLPLAALIGAIIVLEMMLVLLGGFRLTDAPPLPADAARLGNSKLLGVEIYTRYLFALEVAAVVLLVAMIAAIALTLRKRKDSRYINPADQVSTRKADRLRIVQMPPVVEPPAAASAAPAESKGRA